MVFALEHWLALVCLASVLGLALATLGVRLREKAWSRKLGLPALLLFAYGVGAFDFLSDGAGTAIATSAFGVFVLLLILLVFTGFWLAFFGYALAALFFFGLGAWTGAAVKLGAEAAIVFLGSLRPLEPWWLLLLSCVPALIWTSFRNLSSLGPVRRCLVLGLRCALIVLLALALAEMQARRPNESVTVLFLWDRSLSMPPEVQDGEDVREKRILAFINDSVALRGGKHARDGAGLIVFGKRPKLELPPGVVPKFGWKKMVSELDRSHTDIAAALKLALASFPEGAGKRIVLISDGNENIGNAEQQARIAKQNGVQIDVVPIAANRQQQNEILIDRIEAPALTEKGSRLPIRVVVRSYHPQVVVAQLDLRKSTFDPANDFRLKQDNEKTALIVKLRQGLNVFSFPQAGGKDEAVHTYQATVIPLRIETAAGKLVREGLPGDRVENNEARASVISRGEPTLLLLEPSAGAHQLLVDRLRKSKPGLKIAAMTPEQMQRITKEDPEALAIFLARFGAVILANVPADSLSEKEQQVFRSAVHDQGAGLIMIGGDKSFGAGGWQNTEIEKALPVNMELKSMKIEGKSGLVLMMHASEMAEGNAWQRTIAKLAVEKLSPMDMIGQLHYDHGFNGGVPGHRWHVPFQEIGRNRAKIIAQMDKMEPGDMPDVDPAFEKAYKALTNPEYQLGTRHIIFISDGDHWIASRALMQKIKAAKITCSTVCITSHGQDERNKMQALVISSGGRGKFYDIRDPKELPRIYVRESRLVSQSFVYQKPFEPILLDRQGPTEGMPKKLPLLYGFDRTTAKESNLVQLLIETEKIGEYKFPILASWQYGLGKSVAFTSDARTLAAGSGFWDRDWANSKEGIYSPFWTQMVDWVMRPSESGKRLFVRTEPKEGKIRVIVEAQDLDKTPLTEVTFDVGITSPNFKIDEKQKKALKFEQTNAGVYEAEFPADEVGTYFLNLQANWKQKVGNVEKEQRDNVSASVTIPYSPEFAEMESKPELLEKLAQLTGGKSYADDGAVLAAAARSADVFRSMPLGHGSVQALWPWLVFLAGLCLLLDVAIRRIAVQPESIAAKTVAVWRRLRRQSTSEEPTPIFIERLKTRKAQVEEALEKQRASRKFEPTSLPAPVKPIERPTALPGSEAPKPAEKPAKEEPHEDFAARLLRAKQRAQEEREKDKPK